MYGLSDLLETRIGAETEPREDRLPRTSRFGTECYIE